MNQKEFEEAINNIPKNQLECNQLYSIYQATPFYNKGDVLLPIKVTAEIKAEEWYKNTPSNVQEFIHITRAQEKIKEDEEHYKYLYVRDHNNVYFSLMHDNDKIFCGYHNIYQSLKELAQFCEDSRFFLSDINNNWVDEYNITNKVLYFQRHIIPAHYYGDDLGILEHCALQDQSLRTFCCMAYLDQVKSEITWIKEDLNCNNETAEDHMRDMEAFFTKAMKIYKQLE